MITGSSKIKDISTLINYLESEILELEFAIYDRQEGDEMSNENYYIELEAKQEGYKQLLNRLK